MKLSLNPFTHTMPQVVERRYGEPDWTIRLTEVLSPGPYSFPVSEPAHSGKSYEELELERGQIVSVLL